MPPPTHPTPFSLLTFFSPPYLTPDPHNRTLVSILAWPDTRLESSHSYIQYLFPLPEASPFNPLAPIITADVCAAFRARPELRAGLRMCFERMLAFYGFELLRAGEGQEGAAVRVVRSAGFPRAARTWLTRFNHNHLRITRIIRCLRVLGCGPEAAAFFSALREVCEKEGRVGETSARFWNRAATRPLWVRPEVEDEDVGVGRGWLWELERRNG